MLIVLTVFLLLSFILLLITMKLWMNYSNYADNLESIIIHCLRKYDNDKDIAWIHAAFNDLYDNKWNNILDKLDQYFEI